MTLVSVVTVVKNDPEGLLATARSLMKQSHEKIEWIVIDGDSSDITREYIHNLSPFIHRSISEHDEGIYDAMNKGTSLTSGEWLMYLNAGDIFYDESTVATYVEHAKETDHVLYSDAMRLEDKRLQPYPPLSKLWVGMPFDHQTTFTRRTLSQRFSFDSTLKISGDLDFFSCLAKNNFTFRKLQGVTGCIKPFLSGASSAYATRQQERTKVLRRHYDSPELRTLLLDEFKFHLTLGELNTQEFEQLVLLLEQKQ